MTSDVVTTVGRSRGWLVLTAVAGVGLAAACTLGPDPERPVTAADTGDRYLNGEAAREQPPLELESPWWESFGDPETSRLVREALENNTDLQVAAARVLEAEASLAKAGASRWPQVDYELGASRTKTSFVLPEIGRRSIFSTNYTTDVSVAYVVDIFGKLKRTRQAAWASLLAEEAAAEAVMHSVIAGVVRARVQVATLERAHDIATEIRSSWESTLRTVERRYRSGLVGAVDLYLARENLSSAQSAEVTLAGAVQEARHALDVLVGRRPGSGPELPNSLPELPGLEPVPLGLPVELLDRRPDLRQAEERFAAATYGVGAALADLYPSLTIGGSVGTRSDTIDDLLSADAVVYQALMGLAGPLFTGGARRAEVAAARARVEQAAASYAGAVLVALREVEDALVRERSVRESLAFTDRRVAEARAANRLSRERYQRGVETLLQVLETDRRLRAAEEALITGTADLWGSRIDLFLALGGDWYPSTGDGGETGAAEVESGSGPSRFETREVS
jgi:multidrug efflux system outer membrane protein